ncbi:MAG: hypothetical protein KBT35_01340 [Firmicutes bacterium]|nr:hypothetical protein [Candidatus Colivicinus equi]
MKIYKSKYGYSTTAHSKDLKGNVVKNYIDVQFKIGTEPKEDLEGELQFVTSGGDTRKCFLTSYIQNEATKVKLVVMEAETHETESQKDSELGSKFGKTIKMDGVNIESDDLPFY